MHTGSVPRLHDPFHAATLSHVAVKWAPVALLEATSAHTAGRVRECAWAPRAGYALIREGASWAERWTQVVWSGRPVACPVSAGILALGCLFAC
jgi:hypothetical protein